MSNLTNFQRKLSEGITGWLTFEFYCFRGKIFSEKYLSYPIGQILNSIGELRTSTEVNHPKNTSKVGRPLQVDFVLKKDNSEEWEYAIESKWIGDTTITISSIIWDFIRLQNLHENNPKLKSYFVLSGFQKKIKILLEQLPLLYEGENKSSKYVDVNSHYITLNLKYLDEATKLFVNDKIKKYSGFKLYSKIKLRPAHVFPRKDIINMTFSTYVSEVIKPDKTKIIKKL